jgi:histidyl-tRNA synthetase
MIEAPEQKREGYYFGAMDEEAIETLYKEATHYRKENKVTISYEKKSLKAHLKGADRAMARYCAIIGEDELKNGKLWVKDLEEKKEALVDFKAT